MNGLVLVPEDTQGREVIKSITSREALYKDGEFIGFKIPDHFIVNLLSQFEDKLTYSPEARKYANKFRLVPLSEARRETSFIPSKDGREPFEYQRDYITIDYSIPALICSFTQGLGKMQPVSEPILTPEGWKTIGDIREGDLVVGSAGKPIKVLRVFPQTDREVYKVTFSDGASTRCGPEHLWQVYKRTTHRKYTPRKEILTTEKILEEMETQSERTKQNNIRRYRIPLVSPIEFNEKQFSIPPYLMGTALGDGHITKYGGATITTGDLQTIELCGGGHNIREYNRKGTYSFTFGPEYSGAFTKYGLAHKLSYEKFVPREYFLGSVQQRLDLLQGLLDTDGSARSDGIVEFCSTSKQLVEDVIELVRSLGGITRPIKQRQTFYTHKGERKPGRISWRTNIKLMICPFKLTRKINVWNSPTDYLPIRIIEKIEKDIPEESVCILVDSEDHLYVTKDYILTHNTVASLIRANSVGFKKLVIICPKNIIPTWVVEIEKVLGINALVYRGTPEARAKLRKIKSSIVVTNYEMVKELGVFDYAIIDEVQNISNPATVLYKQIFKFLRKMRFIQGLSGTPMRLRIMDLWSVINLINPNVAGSQFEFSKKYEKQSTIKINRVNASGLRYKQKVTQVKGIQNNEEFAPTLASFMYRVKRDNYTSFKDTVLIEYTDMTEKQRRLYQELEQDVVFDVTESNVLTRVLRLMQAAEGEFNFILDSNESGKLKYLISEIDARPEKLIIWSRFKPINKKLIDLYKDRTVMYNGDVSYNLRKLAVMSFQGVSSTEEEKEFYRLKKLNPDWAFEPGEATIFTGTVNMRSSLGLNLPAADTTYFTSFDPNPNSNIQAKDRMARITQLSDEITTKFIFSRGTIEDRAFGVSMDHYENSIRILDGVKSTDFYLAQKLLKVIHDRNSGN